MVDTARIIPHSAIESPSMSSMQIRKILAYFGTVTAIAASPGHAQRYQVAPGDLASRRNAADSSDSSDEASSRVAYSFRSRSDSIAWARNRLIADRASGFRLVVSLQDRHLWAIIGSDTVLSAPVAVAKGTTLEFGKQEWKFDTPRGVRRVLGKEADPVWQPPEWLYAETALEHDLKLGHIYPGKPVKLDDGRKLAVMNGVVGIIDGGSFAELPTDEHIVF